MVTCVWFKRDLRCADHAALVHAVALGGPVVPFYGVEPDYWQLSDTSGRHWDFIRESLVDLDAALALRGARLVIRVGPMVHMLETLRRDHGITQLISHEETGNAWTFARDRAVAAWARAQGVIWQQMPQSGVVRGLRSRNGWAARRDGFVGGAVLPAPDHVPGLDLRSDALPDGAALGLRADPCPGRQAGGRAQALALMDSFLTLRGREYRRAMSSPLTGAAACSRLSPHLALGTVSVREVVQAAQAAARPDASWKGALRAFEARLAWRDHFTQKLEDQPGLEHRCLHPAYEVLRPRPSDPARLAAWAVGRTGLPFVDACMRALRQTGWLNFRMRSMVMAVASYHLWLDWRDTGPILARLFTDYDPGIHWPQVQMQSGTTGMNTIRIYNPVKQGLDQDPTGVFTRTWLPELDCVPLVHLQAPWRWTGAGAVLGRVYPHPLVDPLQAAQHARDAVWAVRQRSGFGAVAQDLVQRHASRADPRGRFVNDRARAARPRNKGQPAGSPQDQLKFEF